MFAICDIFRTFAPTMDAVREHSANLESKRGIFFLLGFTLVLSVLFILLEWSSAPALPPAGEEIPFLVVESEYGYVVAPAEAEAEIRPELPAESPVLHEGYNLVEETPVEALPEPVSDPAEAPAPEAPVADPLPDEVAEDAQPPVPPPVDGTPQFPGGSHALNRYLFDNLKYPASASSQGIEGCVWSSFIVDKDGSLTDIRIEQGVYLSLDQETLRVLQSMPPWTPGIVQGKPAAMKVYLPIVFKL
jgi:protein TonB